MSSCSCGGVVTWSLWLSPRHRGRSADLRRKGKSEHNTSEDLSILRPPEPQMAQMLGSIAPYFTGINGVTPLQFPVHLLTHSLLSVNTGAIHSTTGKNISEPDSLGGSNALKPKQNWQTTFVSITFADSVQHGRFQPQQTVMQDWVLGHLLLEMSSSPKPRSILDTYPSLLRI